MPLRVGFVASISVPGSRNSATISGSGADPSCKMVTDKDMVGFQSEGSWGNKKIRSVCHGEEELLNREVCSKCLIRSNPIKSANIY